MYTQFNSSQLSDQTLDEVRQARKAQLVEIQQAQRRLAKQQSDLAEMVLNYTTTESQPAARSSPGAAPSSTYDPEPAAVFTGTWSGQTGEWH